MESAGSRRSERSRSEEGISRMRNFDGSEGVVSSNELFRQRAAEGGRTQTCACTYTPIAGVLQSLSPLQGLR
ncbi:hypothetical protein SUGI_0219760 [Cryptomeria japonica]|nr:hypothetical protein SUGI_0219760 [Cryptomeria japonica]